MNKNFWFGTEAEGRLKGLPTLFIRGDQSIKDIRKAIKRCNPKHLYFGAGNQSYIKNFYILEYFSKEYLVSFETENISNIPISILQNPKIHIIYTIKCFSHLYHLKSTDTLKLDMEEDIYTIAFENMFKTKINELKKDRSIKI